MKTIKQIADELGVSKDSLKKRLNREPLKSEIESHIETVNGIKYVMSKGCEIIRNIYKNTGDKVGTSGDTTPKIGGDNPSLSGDIAGTSGDTTPKIGGDNPSLSGDIAGTSGDTSTNRLISMLQAQLDRKDKQIEELNTRLAEVTELANTSQRLHAGTMQQQLVSFDETEPPIEQSHSDEQIAELKNQVEMWRSEAEQLSGILAEKQNKEKQGFFGLFRKK